MNDWHELFGNQRISMFCDGHVSIATLGESNVATPVISDNFSARHHDTFNETTKRIGAPIRYHSNPDASGVAAISSRVELGAWLLLPHLNRSSHKSLMVNASPLSACTSAHPSFISLDMLAWFSTNPILIWAHHANTQLVKYLEGGFIARKPELPLELNSRNTWRLAGDQIAAQNQTESGVCVPSMTVPAVRRVSRRHFRQRSTPGRVVIRYGSPEAPQCGQVNSPPHLMRSRYVAQAASSGNSR